MIDFKGETASSCHEYQLSLSIRDHKQGSRVSKRYCRKLMNQLVHFVTAIAVLRDSSNYFPQAQEERSLGRSVLNTALTILPLLYFSSGVKRVKKKKTSGRYNWIQSGGW